MELIDALKLVVSNYMANEGLCDLIYATYTEYGLQLDNKPMKIDLDMVDVPKHLTDYRVKIELNGLEQEAIIKNKLEPGERVAVIKKQGGQQYSIIDRL